MAPCLRLYAYLACQLARAYPFADHEYTGVCCGVGWVGGVGWVELGGGAGDPTCWQAWACAFPTLASHPLTPCPPTAGPHPPAAEWVRSYSSAEYLRLPARAEAVLDEAADAEPYGAWPWRAGGWVSGRESGEAAGWSVVFLSCAGEFLCWAVVVFKGMAAHPAVAAQQSSRCAPAVALASPAVSCSSPRCMLLQRGASSWQQRVRPAGVASAGQLGCRPLRVAG